MKKKMQEFEKKTRAELTTLLAEKREELREFRFGMAGSRTRNTKQGQELRRGIARLHIALANAPAEHSGKENN